MGIKETRNASSPDSDVFYAPDTMSKRRIARVGESRTLSPKPLISP